jgi:hypothetical protein
VDFNSNGRFDDQVSVRNVSRGRVYPQYGDLLLVDPTPENVSFGFYDLAGSQLGKMLQIGSELYDVAVPPAGDKLTLSPYSGAMGRVSLPCDGFSALLYGESGFLKIAGEESDSVALPAGDWKLSFYTIDRTGDAAGSGENKSSLLEMLSAALQSSVPRSRTTRLMAYAMEDTKSVTVRDGQTSKLPFGGAFRPVITASSALRAGETVKLGLSLIGPGGERCTSLTVNGKRPSKPEFTITTPEGEEVATGSFEYG